MSSPPPAHPARSGPRRAATVALTVALWAGSHAVGAQPGPPSRGEDALDLATRGRVAFDRGDLAGGCPLLERAYQLDGSLLGAGFAVAECAEISGKLATAWRTFGDVAEKARARGEKRAAEAGARADALEPRLSRLRLVVAPSSDAPDLVVTVDGVGWPRSSWATSTPIDGGRHEVVVRASGDRGWSRTVVVPPERGSVDLAVELRPEGPANAEEEPAPPPEDDGFPWKTTGLIGAAVGVGTLAAGVVIAVVAKADYDGVDDDCDEANACTAAAAAMRNDAVALSGVGTALFVAGGVLTVAGGGLYLFAPSSSAAPTVAARVGPASLAIDGSF